MIRNLIIASLLAGTSVEASGQQAAGATGTSFAVWPHMHQCTIRPASTDGWSRIQLNVAATPGGSAAPTITALAIKTKGTGAQRQTYNGHSTTLKAIARAEGEVRNQNPIGVDCVDFVVTGDEAAQKASAASFAFMQSGGQGLGWSCSVSGNEEQPTFNVSLFVPGAPAQPGAKRADWSWGATNSGGHVSIVSRSADGDDSWHVGCASKIPRKTGYDLAVLKKP